jgi:MFS family permease
MTVLILGSLSDHVGRRPVIITALAVDAAACILFLLAHGAGALFAARALQGVAAGLAATALGAAPLDLRPAGSLAPLVSKQRGHRRSGPRRVGNQRAGPVRPGPDDPGVVAAAG